MKYTRIPADFVVDHSGRSSSTRAVSLAAIVILIAIAALVMP